MTDKLANRPSTALSRRGLIRGLLGAGAIAAFVGAGVVRHAAPVAAQTYRYFTAKISIVFSEGWAVTTSVEPPDGEKP